MDLNFGLKKLQCQPILRCATVRYTELFRCGSPVWQTDGQNRDRNSIHTTTCTKNNAFSWIIFLNHWFHGFIVFPSTRDHTAEQGMVTQSDPWPMWPMTHGSPGPSPILAQALHRFIDYPALYLDIVGVHTHCTHTFKMLHNCTCKQTAHTRTCKFRVLIYYHCHNI